MNLDNLTDEEVKNLILITKQSIDKTIKCINEQTPFIGRVKRDIKVVDYENMINYTLHVYRGNLENKYSMHIRFNNNYYHLLRLCINGSFHNNSDGTNVGRNHFTCILKLKMDNMKDMHMILLNTTFKIFQRTIIY